MDFWGSVQHHFSLPSFLIEISSILIPNVLHTLDKSHLWVFLFLKVNINSCNLIYHRPPACKAKCKQLCLQLLPSTVLNTPYLDKS